jgi:signal transduction histidine kinase/uncharacterized RDD family membrane protein YckC
MTSATFLGAQILYFLLGVLCLVEYLRRRDKPRLVVALTFGAFAGFILTQDLLALGIEQPVLVIANRLLLLAHPALMVFLINYIVPVARWLRRVVLWGFILIAALTVLLPPDLINLGGLLILAYFVIFEGYAALATVRGMLQTTGTPRRRLMLAAAGSAALAGVVIYLLFTALLPVLQPTVVWVVPLAINLSALCHYLGFATPRWLRKTWQLNEFQKFLNTVGGQPAAERASRAIEELCRASVKVAGGLAATVALADPDTGQLSMQSLPGWPQLTGPLPAGAGAVGRAWTHQEAEQAATRDDFGMPADRLAGLAQADTMLAVPLSSVERRWGLLLVFRRGQSPFVPDDFSLLKLLTEQTALALDYAALITQLRQRTVQLETSNKELEAFAYSVSHDLRSPLRAVNGFSHALREDFGSQLPPEAHSHLNRIEAAVERMGSLIDDLLQLARVARTEMRMEAIDLSRIAGAVIDDLRAAQPGRQVVVVLQPGLAATGDERLLRLVLDNLIGNAWKFTGQRDSATIEVGAKTESGESVYFVRDNGAGFDMAHAARLFSAFQRMHPAQQFPGTGVGLAIVERIIQRHAGRIWAEAQVDQGAAFYFTLGMAPLRARASAS